MGYFRFPCPGCGTAGSVHDPSCGFDDVDRGRIERAYIDVVATLGDGARPERDLRASIAGWSGLHGAALARLRREGRVVEDGDDGLAVATGAEQAERIVEPTVEPIRTIHRHGSVPGCHDNAVFAMIAWYEMVGLTWEETRERVLEWLQTSDTWARGGFDEATPEQLVDAKRHVYEEGYGWREKAESAKRVIERQLDL